MSEEHRECIEAFIRMGPYLDRELSEAELTQVEAHLSECGHCKNAFRWEESVLKLVKRCVTTEDIPDDLREQILGSIRAEPE